MNIADVFKLFAFFLWIVVAAFLSDHYHALQPQPGSQRSDHHIFDFGSRCC